MKKLMLVVVLAVVGCGDAPKPSLSSPNAKERQKAAEEAARRSAQERRATLKRLLLIIGCLLWASPAWADAKTKAAQEVVDFVLQKFGREAVKDGAALARQLEKAAAAHGDEVFTAVKKVGPRGLTLIEESGTHSGTVARVLATHGEEGLVFIAKNPQALRLLEEHGEQAAIALVKSKGVAGPVIDRFGKPAVGAFQALETPQNARRLAMLADSGELAKAGHSQELLEILERYGDPACEFLYKHKEILAGGAVLTAFIASPAPFISGAKDLTEVVAVNAVKPLADVPAVVAKEGVQEVARQTHWTLVFLIAIAATTLLVGAWVRPALLRKTAS